MSKIYKSTTLTTKDVQHVAKLANLNLTDTEIKKFRKQLSEVLNYIYLLQEVDTEGVEETSQVTGLTNVLRDDKPSKSLSQNEALSNTKKTKDGYFVVPEILNST